MKIFISFCVCTYLFFLAKDSNSNNCKYAQRSMRAEVHSVSLFIYLFYNPIESKFYRMYADRVLIYS